MTPEQHNKYLAISHIANGAFYGVLMVMMLVMFGALIFSVPSSNSGNASAPKIFVIVLLIIAFIYSILIIPSFVAAYALLKRKSWAKLAAIIGGVVAGMNFPIGTAVCVYTFWFLFSEPGRLLYDNPVERRLDRRPERESGVISASAPPNWR